MECQARHLLRRVHAALVISVHQLTPTETLLGSALLIPIGFVDLVHANKSGQLQHVVKAMLG